MEIRHLLELGKDGKGEPSDVSVGFSWLILRPDVILMVENTAPHNTTNAKERLRYVFGQKTCVMQAQ